MSLPIGFFHRLYSIIISVKIFFGRFFSFFVPHPPRQPSFLFFARIIFHCNDNLGVHFRAYIAVSWTKRKQRWRENVITKSWKMLRRQINIDFSSLLILWEKHAIYSILGRAVDYIRVFTLWTTETESNINGRYEVLYSN